MKRMSLLAVLLALVCSPCYAYDHQRAKENFAEDVSACVAYFTITVVNARKNAETDRKWADIATQYTSTLTNSITLLKVTMDDKPEKFVEAKIDLRLHEQLGILKSEGLDRLIFLHKDLCKELMENPTQRLRYWEEK